MEKVPRILPEGLAASFNLEAWKVPPIFTMIEEMGRVDHLEMYNIFNMGIGMVLVVSPDQLDQARTILDEEQEPCALIGQVTGAQDGQQVILNENGRQQ